MKKNEFHGDRDLHQAKQGLQCVPLESRRQRSAEEGSDHRTGSKIKDLVPILPPVGLCQ